MKSLSKSSHSLAKLGRLNWSDQWLLVRAFVVLVACKGLLLIFPFSRFIASARLSATPEKNPADALIDKRVWAVRVVSARIPGGFTCLVQALAAKWLLRNHPDVRVHIGVRNNSADGFSAHAWLTYRNRIILGEHANQAFEPILAWQ